MESGVNPSLISTQNNQTSLKGVGITINHPEMWWMGTQATSKFSWANTFTKHNMKPA
jgi:hypothetical protein